jgi:hypothetical protein
VRVLFVKQDHSSPDGLIGDAFAAAGCDVSEMAAARAHGLVRRFVFDVARRPAEDLAAEDLAATTFVSGIPSR